MACTNQELGNQVNVDDPITVPISGRDFAQSVDECEDIAVEIYEFYKQTFPEGLMAMMAIPSDLVLIEESTRIDIIT
jgi:hypothetical protein